MSGENYIRLPDPSANDISDEQVVKLLKFVKANRGKSVKVNKDDKGECWSLAFKALEAAGADKPCTTCKGVVGLYVWGRQVTGLTLSSGDIIQIEGSAKLTTKDNSILTFPHDHHTMVIIEVESKDPAGPIVRVAHQWPGSKVHYDLIRLNSKTGEGVMFRYRPQSTNK